MLLFSSNAVASVINPSSGGSQQDNKSLTAFGAALQKKFTLIEGLADFDKSDDRIFIAPSIFYDQFFGNSKIDAEYGFGFNLGYNYKKYDVFANVGFLRAKFDYQVSGQIEEYERNASFYGFGAAYNFNARFSTFINSKFYEISFADRAENDFKSDNIAFTFGISINL
jgi:hypothetical protein